MSFQTYKVTCRECKSTRTIQIHQTPIGERIDWLEDKVKGAVRIISGRMRLDNQWGWECLCGNDDLMTKQERKSFSDLTAPSPQEMSQVVKNLKPDKPKFEMVVA